MKNQAVIITLILAALAVLLVATKPGDQECINVTRSARGDGDPAGELITHLVVNRYTVNIEDHIFYKQVYSSIDGRRLATGIMGMVIVN